MKTKKLKLENLKVQSFITELNSNGKHTIIIGGNDNVTTDISQNDGKVCGNPTTKADKIDDGGQKKNESRFLCNSFLFFC